MQSVDVDLATKRAEVEYDSSKVTLRAMRRAIRDAGYDVKE